MKQTYQRPTRTPAQFTDAEYAAEAAYLRAQADREPTVAEASRPSQALVTAIDADAVRAAREDPYFD